MAAYLIVDVEVNDAAAYEAYRSHAPALIAAHGGRYLVRGGAVERLEGQWQPHRMALLEFPSLDALRAFYADPAYQGLKALRVRAATSQVLAVEGL